MDRRTARPLWLAGGAAVMILTALGLALAAQLGSAAERPQDRVPPAADSWEAGGERAGPSGLWSRRAGRSLTVPPALADSTLVTVSTDGRVQAWHLADGRRLWARRFKFPLEGPAVHGRGPLEGIVALASRGRGQGILALSAASGRLLWNRKSETAVLRLAASDTLLIVQEQTGRLSARALRDGREIWGRSIGEWGSPGFRLEDGVLYAAARDDSVTALSASDGRTRWTASPGGRFAVDPVRCGSWLAVTSADGEVVWLRAADWGEAARSRRAVPQIAPGVAVGERLLTVSAGGIVEFGGPDAAGDAWRVDLESAVAASPVVAGGRVLIATTLGQLRVLDLKDGRPLGVSQSGAGFRVAPLVAGSILVLADDKGNVHAYRY